MTPKPIASVSRAAEMVNRPHIPDEWTRQVVTGESRIAESIAQSLAERVRSKKNGRLRIVIDGHLGVPWDRVTSKLCESLKEFGICPETVDTSSVFRTAGAIEAMLKPYLPDDPVFGRVYEGKLLDFFDSRKMSALRKRLTSFVTGKASSSRPHVMICYGSGSAAIAPRTRFDLIFYIDLCREEILKRLKMDLVTPLGTQATKPAQKASSADGLPAYFSTRRLYYVDYAVLDKHRKSLLKTMDYYIDGNCLDNPKMLPADVFRGLFDELVSGPIKPKPYYDPGPWGGQWLKKIRKLPKDMLNCAWSYDLIEPETSLLVAVGEATLEFPFPVLTAFKPKDILGSLGRKKKYQGQFPIRINYDDSYQGGDMALQSHPNSTYIKKHFNEPFGQDESYYIVDTAPGSKVHLGLKEEADLEEFRAAVIRAEKEQVPFDHNQFVNSLPSERGDLFLIPAGTLHGSGKNETVLEISATTYRYTFHFYDFLRPGLDGKLRPIHSEHAFAALKPHRRTRWVLENLKQEPRVLRKGKGWAEYLLGARRDLFFKVHRLEFDRKIEDDTRGEFHLIVPVVGAGIRIIPLARPDSATELEFSYLALMPATLGRYRLESLDGGSCEVVKVLMA